MFSADEYEAMQTRLIQPIDAFTRLAVVITGGATALVPLLAARSGASRHLVEIVTPYSRASLADYLQQGSIERACCQATAVAMARVAHRRASRYADAPGSPIGIAVTAIMPSQDERQCEAHLAWHGNSSGHVHLRNDDHLNRADAERWMVHAIVTKLLCEIFNSR